MLKAWRNVDRVRLDLIYRRLNIKVKRFLLQNFRTLLWSTDEQTRCVLPHATTDVSLRNMIDCDVIVFRSSLVPAHLSALDGTPATTSVLSLIRGTKSFFPSVTIPTSLQWLNWAVPGIQIVRGKDTRNVRGAEKRKKESLPLLCYSEKINEYYE